MNVLTLYAPLATRVLGILSQINHWTVGSSVRWVQLRTARLRADAPGA